MDDLDGPDTAPLLEQDPLSTKDLRSKYKYNVLCRLFIW